MNKIFFLFLCFFTSLPVFSNEINGWHFNLLSKSIQDSFYLNEDMKTYTGEIERMEMKKEPKEGFVYILLKIQIQQKDNDNQQAFDPFAFVLKVDNSEFFRQDDYFLIDYHIKPITHLSVRHGTYTGHLLFEVPQSLKNEPATLFYHHQKIE